MHLLIAHHLLHICNMRLDEPVKSIDHLLQKLKYLVKLKIKGKQIIKTYDTLCQQVNSNIKDLEKMNTIMWFAYNLLKQNVS